MKKRDLLLNELQGIDLARQRLEGKKNNLPQKVELESLKREASKVEKELFEKRSSFEERQKKQKKLEGELDLLDLKIKREEGRLFNGSVSNPKELSDIQSQVNLLKKKKDEMETVLLGELEIVEKLTLDINFATKKLEEISGELNKAQETYQKEIEKIEREILGLVKKRKTLVSKISPDTIVLYESLRKERDGLGAIEIKEGVCQGCFVELPAEEADKMMGSSELWQCPNCRRILIRLAKSEASP